MGHRSYTTVLDQPAAGHDWSFVPSSSDWSRLLSITATLTVSATDIDRYAGVTVTDETGNLITNDVAIVGQDNNGAAVWSWRPGNLNYNGTATEGGFTGSIPGFWLPAGATVEAETVNLDAPHADVQALIVSGDEHTLLPVTIVLNTNDKFSYTPGGGGGAAEDFQIAAGVYATIATMAAAINAAIGSGAEAFSTKCTCVANAGSTYKFTAVSDVGTAGNGNLVATGSVHDAFASIFAEGSPLTLAGGVNADGGDQWSNVVATYVVADAQHWRTVEALIAQISAGT